MDPKTLSKDDRKLLPLVAAYIKAQAEVAEVKPKRESAEAAAYAHANALRKQHGQDYDIYLDPEMVALHKDADALWTALDKAVDAKHTAFSALNRKLGSWATIGHINATVDRLRPYVEAAEAGEVVVPQPPAIPEDAERVTAYRCLECEEVTEEDDRTQEPLYECGSCGTKFTRENSADGSSHRCPDCNKFASRASEATGEACPACEAGELEQVEAVVCPEDGDVVLVEDWEEHAEKHAEEGK